MWVFVVGFVVGYACAAGKILYLLRRNKGLVRLEYEIKKAKMEKELDSIAAQRERITSSRGT